MYGGNCWMLFACVSVDPRAKYRPMPGCACACLVVLLSREKTRTKTCHVTNRGANNRRTKRTTTKTDVKKGIKGDTSVNKRPIPSYKVMDARKHEPTYKHTDTTKRATSCNGRSQRQKVGCGSRLQVGRSTQTQRGRDDNQTNERTPNERTNERQTNERQTNERTNAKRTNATRTNARTNERTNERTNNE